jgi:glucokinase
VAKGLILAGDVGGTKTNLALVPALDRGLVGAPIVFESYRSADYPSLEAMLDAFTGAHDQTFDAASFGFAGAVANGRGVGTNIPWSADRASLARHLSLPRAHVLNDLVATGYGVAALATADLYALLPGTPAADGNAGIVAPGTGLGEALLARVDDHLVPIASEGGHADFAPRTDLELEVFHALRARFGRVSCERVLSGPGLGNIAGVLHALLGADDAWRSHEAEAGGANALPEVISRLALAGTCPECAGSLDLFVGVFGAESGNLALRGVTRGGIYLAGGIAPRIVPALQSETFREAFVSKDPHRPLLEAIPVWVIRNEGAALLGAARYATL